MTCILAIEDELQIRLNLQQILELGGYEALTAQDGQEGLELARKHRPDLIISDIMMPRLDGYGLLEALRQDPTFVNTPVILLTAKADRPDQRKGMELGADDYLTKPFTPPELLAAVEARLSKKISQTEAQEQKMEELRQNLSLALPHELNTPLNSIMSFTRLLLDTPNAWDPAETQEMLGYVYSSAERLYHTIQNFLLYADLELKLKDAANGWQRGAFDIPLQSLANVAELQLGKLDRLADLQMMQLPDVLLWMPQRYAHTLMIELVDNAAKFSEPGAPIVIEGEVQDDKLVLTFKDWGRGMTAEQIQQVGAYVQFERRIYEQQGSGLGLAIVKRIAQMLGGSLTLQSQPPQASGASPATGADLATTPAHTVVTLCLPCKEAEPLEDWEVGAY